MLSPYRNPVRLALYPKGISRRATRRMVRVSATRQSEIRRYSPTCSRVVALPGFLLASPVRSSRSLARRRAVRIVTRFIKFCLENRPNQESCLDADLGRYVILAMFVSPLPAPTVSELFTRFPRHDFPSAQRPCPFKQTSSPAGDKNLESRNRG
jgi:hypothetical protein